MDLSRRNLLKSGLSLGVGYGGMISAGLAEASGQNEHDIETIAFGSCNHTDKSQHFWANILNDAPELFLSIGDNIYSDHATTKERQQIYSDLANDEYYKIFRNLVRNLGTWDDHDYASDNADCTFKDKEESQELFLNFFSENNKLLTADQSGIYGHQTMGSSGKKISLYLLDCRYFMKKKGPGKTILGDQQWQWFEAGLLNNEADLNIIVSPISISSQITGFGLEGWRQYREERDHLYELIDNLQTPTVFLTGDRHYADITRWELPSGMPIYEFMSSGLTHSTHFTLPNPYSLAKTGKKNYGILKIYWTAAGPIIDMDIKSADYGIVLGHARASFTS